MGSILVAKKNCEFEEVCNFSSSPHCGRKVFGETDKCILHKVINFIQKAERDKLFQGLLNEPYFNF